MPSQLTRTAPGQAPAAASPPSLHPGTVIGTRFDLAFFLLPPLGTVLFVLAGRLWPALAFPLAAFVWVALAQSHFGATALFFLEPESLARYRRHALVYFAVPAALIAGYAILGFTPFARVALLAVPLGSFWHGNKQSIGVCGLFRGLTRRFEPRWRYLETAVIFSGSACFTAVGLVRLDAFAGLGLNTFDTTGLRPIWWTALGLSGLLLALTEAVAYAQCRAARVRPWPRMLLLASSWAMYAPYVVAPDAVSGYLGSLIPHYLQYHGLMYLVSRNKLAERGSTALPLLARVARTPRHYVAGTVGFALVLGALLWIAERGGRPETALALVAGINLAHFWLDGFFWRFRDPDARRATLRYIRPREGNPA